MVISGPILGAIIVIGNMLERKLKSYWYSKKTNEAEIGVAILGMKGAGKTTLLTVLRNKTDEEINTTSYEPYNAFYYTKSNGNTLRIRGGCDIGGGRSYRMYYEDFINNSDIVFFLFDINRWKYFEEDRREIQSRLQFVTEKCKANNKLLITLLTHTDYLNEDDLKETMIQYKSEICKRDHGSYKAAVIDYPFIPIDTTDVALVKKVLDRYL